MATYKSFFLIFALTTAISPGPHAQDRLDGFHANSLNVTSRDESKNNLVLAVPVGGGELKLTAERYFAGAITSITFRGKEFIKTETNRFGIELQTAASFDGLGECFNPTEAGGRYDNSRHLGSSSILIAASAGNGILETTTRMAYWWPPHVEYFSPRGHYCGVRRDIDRPSYSQTLSNFVMHKRVAIHSITLPVNGRITELPWIDYRVALNDPDGHKDGEIEAATGYMPADFTRHLSFDPETSTTSELLAGKKNGMQLQNLPIILATPNEKYAMGVFAPPSPNEKLSYGNYKFPDDTNKWQCLYHEKFVEPGKHQYRVLITLGTVDEVKAVIRRLYSSANKENP